MMDLRELYDQDLQVLEDVQESAEEDRRVLQEAWNFSLNGEF